MYVLCFLSGSELPALLLRDDESAQRAVMMRAAQVLCTGVCFILFHFLRSEIAVQPNEFCTLG